MTALCYCLKKCVDIKDVKDKIPCFTTEHSHCYLVKSFGSEQESGSVSSL